MRKTKVWLIGIVGSCMILALTGCWSVHEVDEIAITNVIGIDQNDKGEVEVSAIFVKPYAVFPEANGGIGSNQKRFMVMKASGKSIFQAMGILTNSISESVYLGHVETIVVGEKAARERMESTLDFFKRENEIRPNVRIVVANGTAFSVLHSDPQLSTTLGAELKGMARSIQYNTAGIVTDLSKFTAEMASNSIDPVTGVIQFASSQGVTSNIPDLLNMQDTAVFKKGNLVGFLDSKETRGLLWIQGKLRNTIVVMNCGGKDPGTVSLLIRDTGSKLSPQIKNGAAAIDVNIHVESSIGEITCSKANLDSIHLEQLNKQLEDQVREQAAAVLKKAREEWQTDIFGFGTAFYRNYPAEWNRLQPSWRNGALQNLKVNVKVSANISRYGLLKDPMKADESR